tara:strand:+ start:8228 stop:8599 length:372 start_codon:yes stop_codon:yes gene_type:complete
MATSQKFRERLKGFADSTLARCIVVGIIALIMIAASFLISVFITKNPSDAGRGGAVVVAMSFYFLLRSKHEIASSVPPDGQKYLHTLLDKETNILVSIMSVLGTLAWGFMDIPAACFIDLLSD